MPSLRQSFAVDTVFGVSAFASIPKCGQHSLQAVSKCLIQREDLRRYPHRIAPVRGVIDRLLSTYHFYMQNHHKLDGHTVARWEDYIDIALVSNDEHVRPQSDFILTDYNIIVKLEYLDDFMSAITSVKMPKLNVSKREFLVDTSYRINDIRDKYSADEILYNSAIGVL